MVSKKQLQEALLARLADALRVKGFGARRQQSFIRKTPWGHQSIHLAFIPHQEDFDLTVDVAIRHDALEQLMSEIDPPLAWEKRPSVKSRGQTATLGADVSNIIGGVEQRWTVVTERDLPSVCEGIVQAVDTVGLPYVERFDSLDAMFYVLARDDAEARVACAFPDYRAKSAVIAAYLLGRQEEFEELAERKTQFLKETHDPGLSSFLTVLEELRHRWAADTRQS